MITMRFATIVFWGSYWAKEVHLPRRGKDSCLWLVWKTTDPETQLGKVRPEEMWPGCATGKQNTWANCGPRRQPEQGAQSLPGLLNRCHLWHRSLSTGLRERWLPPFHSVAVCTWHQGLLRLAAWEDGCGCDLAQRGLRSQWPLAVNAALQWAWPCVPRRPEPLVPMSSSLSPRTWISPVSGPGGLDLPQSALPFFLPVLALGKAVRIT